MICQRCGREGEPESKFCVDCGAPLELRCPACQTPYLLGGRFCSLCGRSLPEQAVTDQFSDQSQDALQHSLSSSTQTREPDQLTGSTPIALPEQASETSHSSQSEGQEKGEQKRSLSCPRCHQNNFPDSEYCFACGMPLGDIRKDGVADDTSADSLQFSPAGFWIRSFAFVIDAIIVSVSSLAIAYTLLGDLTPQFIESTNFDNLVALLTVVYDTVLIAICATTGGKHQFRLSVVRTDGSRIGPGRALARSIATGLSALMLGLGFLMVAIRKDKRGLHDLICDTKVIKRPGPDS